MIGYAHPWQAVAAWTVIAAVAIPMVALAVAAFIAAGDAKPTPRPPVHELNAAACRRLLDALRDEAEAGYEQARYDAEFVAIARHESQSAHPSSQPPDSAA